MAVREGGWALRTATAIASLHGPSAAAAAAPPPPATRRVSSAAKLVPIVSQLTVISITEDTSLMGLRVKTV